MSDEIKLVKPQVFLVGMSHPDLTGMLEYLKSLGGDAEQFVEGTQGLEPGQILSSFASKLCYLSFAPGVNKNVSRVRDIKANVENCFDVGHGSVFGHVVFNFVFRMSRAGTHELIRHEIGTEYTSGDQPTIVGLHEYSQQSGRYVARTPNFMLDPLLQPYADAILAAREPMRQLQQKIRDELLQANSSMKWKKEVTNAVRYMDCIGDSSDIMFSCNVRALRHILAMRTSPEAAWEISYLFSELFKLVQDKAPWALYGAEYQTDPEGKVTVTAMKTQPYVQK